jgi:hypothetical protein
MLLGEYEEKTQHERMSKHGKVHTYTRIRRMIKLRCDACGIEFIRERGKMDPKRISNNYFHVCDNCDAKRFAQKQGVIRKHIWDMPASSELDISKL